MLGHTIVGIVDNIMVSKLGPTRTLLQFSIGNSLCLLLCHWGIGFQLRSPPLAQADGEV
jgi:MATE family multidrug resistance protein